MDFNLTSPTARPAQPPTAGYDQASGANRLSATVTPLNAISHSSPSEGQQAAQSSVLLLTARVGELASFVASRPKGEAQLSRFEREQLGEIIGSIIVGSCGVGGVFGLDVDAAVDDHLNRVEQRTGVPRPAKQQQQGTSLNDSFKQEGNKPQYQQPSPKESHRPAPLNALLSSQVSQRPSNDAAAVKKNTAPEDQPQNERERWAQVTGGTQEDAGLLSPQTRSNFAPMIEALIKERGSFTEAEFERVGLTFVGVSKDGRLFDLIENGHRTPVTLARFDEYLALLQQQGILTLQPVVNQQSSPPQRSSGLRVGHGSPEIVGKEDGVIMKRFHIDPGIHDFEREARLYSPDHFRGGIFSPHQTVLDVDVAFPDTDGKAKSAEEIPSRVSPMSNVSAPQTVATAEPTPLKSAQATASTSPQQQQQQQQQAKAIGSASPQYHDENERQFWAKFHSLEDHASMKESDFVDLDLRFVLPRNGLLIELTEDGANLPVTKSNCEGFIRLVKEQIDVFDGKIKRQPSVRAHVVKHMGKYDPERDAARYSPGHKEGTLFAPAMDKTTFYIDHEAKQQLLPAALRKIALPVIIPTASHYLEYLTQHPENFPDMIDALRKRPSLASRWNVTYCVPDPALLTAGPQGGVWGLPQGVVPRCGVRDLVERGRSNIVTERDVPEFLRLVMEAARTLPKCVAPRN